MANEFQLLPNPDNVPGAVSSGYQRQNTNLFELQVGLDNACLYLDAAGKVILRSSSVIEYNGALFKSLADIDLTDDIKNILSSSNYCFFSFDGSAIEAVSDRGILIPSKYARYIIDSETSEIKRVLDVAVKHTISNIKKVSTSNISNDTLRLYGVCYANGLFVAVGYLNSTTNGIIITSPDGTTWTNRTISAYQRTCITYGNGMFVSPGYTVSSYNTVILTSPDGVTWTNRSTNVNQTLNSIVYANGIFVAVGVSGTLLTSSDGITWTSRSSGTTYMLNDIIYANGIFVAVGVSGTLLTSSDGITWTSRSPISSQNLTSISYCNGLLIILDSYKNVFSSPDGINWTNILSNLPTESSNPKLISYNNCLLIASSSQTSAMNCTTSIDGIFWEDSKLVFAANSFAYKDSGLFVTVNTSGFIYTFQLSFDFGKYNPGTNRYDFPKSTYFLQD
jgi:hypothetical protein